MSFGFLVGSKNFCKLLSVSCEVFVLDRKGWIHWVAKSCTTSCTPVIVSRFCILTLIEFWDLLLSSHQNFLREVRFQQCVFVLWQISPFRSFGKWVWTLDHDWYEVLRITFHPNTMFNEMWFLTIGPLIWISVIFEKLSERQYCWRILQDFTVKNVSKSLT